MTVLESTLQMSCIITFLLGSINCPRPVRSGSGEGKLVGENEAYSKEVLIFTKQHVLRQDVQIEVFRIKLEIHPQSVRKE